jgi:hypothetical protein
MNWNTWPLGPRRARHARTRRAQPPDSATLSYKDVHELVMLHTSLYITAIGPGG